MNDQDKMKAFMPGWVSINAQCEISMAVKVQTQQFGMRELQASTTKSLEQDRDVSTLYGCSVREAIMLSRVSGWCNVRSLCDLYEVTQ